MKNYRAPLRFQPSKSIQRRIAPVILGLTLLGAATASAAEVSYRYYRFTPTKNYQDGTTVTTNVQLSEFTFSLRGKLLNVNGSTGIGPVVTVGASGGTNTDPAAAEYASKVVDGDLTTKWYNGDRTQPLVFDFGSATTIDTYNFATANDSITRTPVSWTFEGSNDGTTWSLVDSRTDVAISANLFIYQAGFVISGSSALPAVSINGTIAKDDLQRDAAASTIVKSGSSSSLSWAVTNSTSQSLTDPSGATTVVSATGSQTVTPSATADSVYTLGAGNATGGAEAQPALTRAVPGTTASYTYYRLTTTGRRGGRDSNLVQLSEFEMYYGSIRRTLGSVTNIGGSSHDGEGPGGLIDGNIATKWLDLNNKPLIFQAEIDPDSGSPLPVDGYQLFTANDSPDRDPVRWTLEGSDDLEAWTMIDAINTTDYATPVARQTGAGRIPLSGSALTWTGTGAAWDATATNFKSTAGQAATFRVGAPVLFDDTAAQTTVSLSADMEPGSLSFTNSTKNYTLSGASIVGRASLFKSGTGSLTLGSLNGISGDITVTNGTLVSSVAGGLGTRTVDRNMTITSYEVTNPTLQIDKTQNFQGMLSVMGNIDNHVTVNVADGQTYGSYGVLNLGTSIVKTGKGTLHFEDFKGGSVTSFDDALIVNEGMVEIASSYWNSEPLGGRSFTATVNSGAVLRLASNDVFGGDYFDYLSSLSQLKIVGGTLRLNGNQYIPARQVNNEGPIVLDGGKIDGGYTLDTSHDQTKTNPGRSLITVRANAVGSVILNTHFNTTPVLAADPGSQLVFDVADGGAADDLSVIEDGNVPTYKITGGYGIVKLGAGNMVLGLASDFQGAVDPLFPQTAGTSVDAGTLTVTNATGSATGTGTVAVASGATLAGTGIITGDTTVKGTLAPGKGAVGTLTLGNTSVSGSVAYKISGATSDKVVVNGNLNLTGATLAISAANAPTAGSYVVASYTGALTGTFASVTGLPQGYTLVSNTAAKTIELQSGTPQTGYDAWASAAGLSGDNALNTADPDGDGIPNGIEFVLGTSPTTADAANLPTATRDASGNMVFTFRRTAASAYLNPGVEYSADLSTWTAAPSADVVVTTNGFATGVDKVVVTLPASLAPNAKLFARLADSIELP